MSPTDTIAIHVAKCLAVYLSEHERDRLNHFGDSEREKMIEWMRRMPASAFCQIAGDLVPYALKIATRDVWEACELAGLCAHHRLFPPGAPGTKHHGRLHTGRTET